MSNLQVRRYGDRAVLVEVRDADAVASLAAALVRPWPAGVVDVVPAARTVLVVFDPSAATADTVERWITTCPPAPLPMTTDAPVIIAIDVVYDGQDLGAVAQHAGFSVDEVVRRHAAARYRCGFCGFAPGFAYLVGLDRTLQVPRRATPRTRVPAGSVAIGGEFTGIYPRAMPGGWQLVGRTDAVVWDLERDPPALIQPGTVVQFRPVPR